MGNGQSGQGGGSSIPKALWEVRVSQKYMREKRAAYLVLVEFGLCQTKPPVLFEPSEQSDTSFMCRAQEEGKLWGVL